MEPCIIPDCQEIKDSQVRMYSNESREKEIEKLSVDLYKCQEHRERLKKENSEANNRISRLNDLLERNRKEHQRYVDHLVEENNTLLSKLNKLQPPKISGKYERTSWSY